MKPDYPISASVSSYTDLIHEHRVLSDLGSMTMPLKNGYCANCMMTALGLPGAGGGPVPYVDDDGYLVTMNAAK